MGDREGGRRGGTKSSCLLASFLLLLPISPMLLLALSLSCLFFSPLKVLYYSIEPSRKHLSFILLLRFGLVRVGEKEGWLRERTDEWWKGGRGGEKDPTVHNSMVLLLYYTVLLLLRY